MNFIISWLKHHLEAETFVDEIADALTNFGLEFESLVESVRSFFDSDLRWLRHYGFASLDTPNMHSGISR